MMNDDGYLLAFQLIVQKMMMTRVSKYSDSRCAMSLLLTVQSWRKLCHTSAVSPL